MFQRKSTETRVHPFARQAVVFEGLEDRRLLSASWGGHFAPSFGGGGRSGGGGRLGGGGQTITFSQAPSAVQTGLTSLASTDNVAAPTATQTVFLGNANGVETYTLNISATGSNTRLTVDQTGTPITAPTHSSTTFGDITNTAVTSEINAIASGLSLTAPASTDAVNVITNSDGSTVYTIALSADTTSTTATTSARAFRHGAVISVDSSGNPVGNESVPFNTLSAAVQAGLTSNTPTGATALTDSSLVDVRTLNGVTTYSASFSSTGTHTTITVGLTGTLTSLPSSTQVAFSTLPAAAQTELQTLATADGASTIADTQAVTAYDEGNGTTVYSVRVSATGTNSDSTTYTYTITVSSDQAGNPTVPPRGGGRGDHFGGGFFSGGFFDAGGMGGGCMGASPVSTTTTGTTTTGTPPTETTPTGTTPTDTPTATTSSIISPSIVTATALIAPDAMTTTPAVSSSQSTSKHHKVRKAHHHVARVHAR